MKHIWKRTLLLILALLLLSGLCACDADGNGTGDGEGEGASSPQITQAEGVAFYGRIAEASLPQSATLQSWYGQAKAREQLTNAIYYAQDTEGLWHCWLYVGEQLEGAALTFGLQTETGDGALRLDCRGSSLGTTGASGVYYFTYEIDGVPSFELYINGEFEGMLETQGTEAVTREA